MDWCLHCKITVKLFSFFCVGFNERGDGIFVSFAIRARDHATTRRKEQPKHEAYH